VARRLLASGSDDADSASSTVHWIKVLIGVLFLVTALPQWRKRPRAGFGPEMPKWMAAIDRFTAVRSLGLGALLSGVNPKNLALTFSASATIAQAGLSGGRIGRGSRTMPMFVRVHARTPERGSRVTRSQRRSGPSRRSVRRARDRLVVGAAGDVHEREADAIARQVVDALGRFGRNPESCRADGPSVSGSRIRRRVPIDTADGVPDETRRVVQVTSADEVGHLIQPGPASEPRRVMRLLVRNAPTYEVRGESLAETMLKGVRNTELGLTIPSLNGTPFFGEGVQVSVTGSAAKPKVDLPDVQVEDSKQGVEYQNQYPTTQVKVWNPWAEEDAEDEYEEQLDPLDEAAKLTYETDRWSGWAQNPPRNVFDWRIQLPPPGPWRKDGVPKTRLVELVEEIGRLSGVAVPDADSLLQGDSGSLVVTDPAGDASLLAHTRQHEHQHVGDHRGLIDEMFGPWDDFSDDHSTRATALRADNPISIKARFQTGGNFTPGADRIASEFGAEMIRSGNAYHGTVVGSVPSITVHSVTTDTVTIHISPHVPLAVGAIPPALYKWGRTKISG
jgi:hypothetical protein